VAIWDLEDSEASADGTHIHLPLSLSSRTSTSESLGITQISFYPFDSLAFLTSGYDRTLKLFSSETLQASGTFDLGSTVYSHATSPVASHLLVACASQHPTVRLVDLRTGSATHSLAGHFGSVLAVAWHPRDENILTSGGSDGACRLWDVRRSASSLGVLDLDDSIGIAGCDGRGTGARRRERGKAHIGAVNGITWSEDGQYLVTIGHDEKMRVWKMTTGANTLANFGPALKNTGMTGLTPLLPPAHLSPPGHDMVFYPNPGEVLSFDLHSGKMLKRLRAPILQKSHASGGNVRNLNTRVTSLAWRAHHVEMYSAHGDGTIRCFRPRTAEDIAADREDESDGEDEEAEAAERKRKRDELDQIVRDLTKKRVTYS
jgi:DNA excision repair protein ERCC-8